MLHKAFTGIRSIFIRKMSYVNTLFESGVEDKGVKLRCHFKENNTLLYILFFGSWKVIRKRWMK
jgi:hypothetical protein